MRVNFSSVALVLVGLTASAAYSATGVHVVQTFETAPENVEDDFAGPGGALPGLSSGMWGTREEANRTTSHRLTAENPLTHPTWNSGGWIEPVGTETAVNNRGPIGSINYEGIPVTAILTNPFTGVVVYDNDTWGDVSDATFLTLDVKGSFSNTGGLSFYVGGDGPTLWSWTANVSNESVGANPGNVTEWTTILVPINRPTIRYDANVFPSPIGAEGHIDGPLSEGGNWGIQGNYANDAEMIADFQLTLSTANEIAIRGLTPDTQIDNLGFILPAVAGTPGDFDSDDDVDGADFLAWQRGESTTPLSASDLSDWQDNYGTTAASGATLGAVPEPTAFALALIAGASLLGIRRKL